MREAILAFQCPGFCTHRRWAVLSPVTDAAEDILLTSVLISSYNAVTKYLADTERRRVLWFQKVQKSVLAKIYVLGQNTAGACGGGSLPYGEQGGRERAHRKGPEQGRSPKETPSVLVRVL